MPLDNDQQPAAGEEDFDAAFAGFAAAKETPPDEGRATGNDEVDDAAAETGQDDPKQAPADAADAETADADPQPAEDDIWANATPAQRAAFEAAARRATTLEHADRSSRGRISTLQRQLNDFTRDGKAASDAPRGAAKVRAMLDSEEVKTAVADYGEANAPLVAVMHAQQEVLDALQARQDEADTARTGSFLKEQAEAVITDHPDYNSIAKSRAFADWYEAAPGSVREMIERNAAQIVDGREVSAVVRLFKAETGHGQTPPTPAPAGASRNDTIRQRQLSGNRTVVNRGPGTPAGVPDDFDAAFDHFAAKKAR